MNNRVLIGVDLTQAWTELRNRWSDQERQTERLIAKRRIKHGDRVRVEGPESVSRGTFQGVCPGGGVLVYAMEYPYMTMIAVSAQDVYPDPPPGDPRWIARLTRSRTAELLEEEAGRLSTYITILAEQEREYTEELQACRLRRDDDRARSLAQAVAERRAERTIAELQLAALALARR